jgi:hypothetical protein
VIYSLAKIVVEAHLKRSRTCTLRNCGLLFISATLAAFVSATAGAASISVSGNTEAHACNGLGDCGYDDMANQQLVYPGAWVPGLDVNVQTSSSSSINGAFSSAFTNVNGRYGFADVQWGINGNTLDAVGGNAQDYGFATTSAGWSDAITFIMSGRYDIRIVTDTTAGNMKGIDFGAVRTATIGGQSYTLDKIGSLVISGMFTKGQIVSVGATVQSGARTQDPVFPDSVFFGTYFTSVSLTVDPGELQVTGASTGIDLADFSSSAVNPYYTTESGFSYLTPASDAPEPGSASMLSIALVILALYEAIPSIVFPVRRRGRRASVR